jgi:hypothetical protein
VSSAGPGPGQGLVGPRPGTWGQVPAHIETGLRVLLRQSLSAIEALKGLVEDLYPCLDERFSLSSRSIVDTGGQWVRRKDANSTQIRTF